MAKNKKDKLPEQFTSFDEAAEFWDNHDLGDYWENTRPVKARIKIKESPRYIAVEENIAKKLTRIARKRKIAADVLANLWLREKISKVG